MAAATASAPTRNAAAPSPKLRSSAERGAAGRQSLATTSTCRAEPAFTASAAARRAVVPARTESAKSAVTTSRRRSSALATTLAACFSLYGYEVDANRTPSTSDAVDAVEAIRTCGDGHRDRVLVEVRDGPFAAAAAGLAPAAADGSERQAEHGNVRAVGCDTDHERYHLLREEHVSVNRPARCCRITFLLLTSYFLRRPSSASAECRSAAGVRGRRRRSWSRSRSR